MNRRPRVLHLTTTDISLALLLGPQFALLGAQFAALRPVSLRRRRDAISRVLLCMGGSDPFNETGKVLAGLSQLPQLYIDVAIRHKEFAFVRISRTVG